MALLPSSIPAAQGGTILGCQLPVALGIACDDGPANLTPSRESRTGKQEYGDDWQLRQKPKGHFKGSHDERGQYGHHGLGGCTDPSWETMREPVWKRGISGVNYRQGQRCCGRLKAITYPGPNSWNLWMLPCIANGKLQMWLSWASWYGEIVGWTLQIITRALEDRSMGDLTVEEKATWPREKVEWSGHNPVNAGSQQPLGEGRDGLPPEPPDGTSLADTVTLAPWS